MKKFTIAFDMLAPYIERERKASGIDTRRITSWNLNKTDLTRQKKAAFLKLIYSLELMKAQKLCPGAAALIESLREDNREGLISSARWRAMRSSGIRRKAVNCLRTQFVRGTGMGLQKRK